MVFLNLFQSKNVFLEKNVSKIVKINTFTDKKHISSKLKI